MEVVRSVLSNLGFDPAIFLSQLALFYILHILLSAILYQPMEKARSDREAVTSERVAEAERLNSQAMELKRSYEERIGKAKQDALAITQKARREAESARLKRLEAARDEANKVIETTRATLAEERQVARLKLKADIPVLSTQVAKKIINLSVEPEMAEHLCKEVNALIEKQSKRAAEVLK